VNNSVSNIVTFCVRRYLLHLLALSILLAPALIQAAPTIQNAFVFSERRGATPLWSSDYSLFVGATSVVPSDPGITVSAIHVPAGSGPDYALVFAGTPVFPNAYSIKVPYAGQTGQWSITGTDSSGTTARLTNILDDVRDLPLITGLTVSGNELAPHVTWDAVDPNVFRSFCVVPCALGDDFFYYVVEVRQIIETMASLIFQSPLIPTSVTGVPTLPMFNIPAGVLSPSNDYLIGIRLQHTEIEAFIPTGGFVLPIENRSIAYVTHDLTVTALSEPSTYAMLLAGLFGIGLRGLGFRRRKHAA
jgi:hypothetical protein